MEPTAPKLILVPTDFSAPSAHALRYGAALADRFSARLLVIHADPFVPAVDFTIAMAGVLDLPREELIENARQQLRTFTEDNVSRAIPYATRVLVGTPSDAIVKAAADSDVDLIVMGTHGRTGISRLLLGSVTEAVMRLAGAPVLAVHDRMRIRTRARFVVGCVGPMREAHAALQLSEVLADPASLYLLLADGPGADGSGRDPNLAAVSAPSEIRHRSQVKVVPSLHARDVLDAAVAEGADLIVLGIPAERNLNWTLRGTLPERVVQQSACPVLVVNGRAATRIEAVFDDPEPVLA